MVHRLLPLLLLVLSTGCSWFGGSDNSTPPAELKAIAQPVGVRQLWEAQVGSGAKNQFIRLTPVLADGRLYAASFDGVVMALDALSGQRLWESATQLSITGGVGVSDNGLVLVGTNKGQVVALRQDNGQEAWRSQVSSEVLAPPRAASGVVVVRTGDGKFTGLDARTGERRWVYAHVMPALSLRGNASPLLTHNLVIAGLETGKLLVLSLDRGLPITEKTIAAPRGRTEIERLIDIDAEPKILGDTLYLVAYRGSVAAIDMHGGNLLWNRELSSYAGLAVDERQVYVSDETDAVLALDRRDGGTRWKQAELTGRRLSAPVATRDHVVVGDFEGYLHWLGKDNGQVVGRIRAASKAIVAPPLAAGDTVFVQGQGGALGAFRAGE
ncbi:MAG: outer membrane protein assembly factor BamB [Candidatus Contendobacter sp.]|nr:outer membrane protein assembly factor BamB [Candidatus Contendobacter sp.]MDS4057516.1 outer membrane protein assembly factor BamB [Candidatus Contendobacter sp.]